MKRLKYLFVALAVALPLCAQTADSKTKPKLFAQKLVDETLAQHPDIVIIGMHAASKGGGEDYPILASNIGRIGKKADEDDLRVIHTGKPNLEVNKKGNHFEVELPLQDQDKKTIGAIGIVFNYKPDADKAELQKKAEEVRDDMAKQIPSLDKLYEPAE